jgi:membrane protein required for colicin V production
VFWIIAYLVGMTVSKVLSVSGLGIFDRILGFVFGASKIFLLFSIISYAITQVKIINDNLAPKLENSIVFPILTQAGKYIIKLDAGNIQQKATMQLDDAIEATKETITEITNTEIQKKVKEVATKMQDNISGNK